MAIYEEYVFSSNRRDIRYFTAGHPANPPIILIHGWLSYHGIWDQTVAALQDRYYCVAIDLLGFGSSAKPRNGDYSIQAQGRRVLALADLLDMQEFTLVGHSMGGMIAVYIAAVLAPQRVTKLLSVSGIISGKPQPLITERVYPIIRAAHGKPAMWETVRRFNRYRPVAKLINRMWFYNMNAIQFHDWAVDRQMAFQPGMSASARPSAESIGRTNLSPFLSHIKAPTLAVFGQQDDIVRPEDGHLLRDCAPDARLVLIDRCGHFPMYEQPDVFVPMVTRFLDGDPLSAA